MTRNRLAVSMLVAALGAAAPASALVLGVRPARTRCFASWQVTTADVVPNHGKVGVDCQDGDPACDVDGQADGTCTFGISVCTGIVDVAGCTPDVVTAVKLNRRAQKLGIASPAVPVPVGTCGAATLVSLPLRTTRKKTLPSRPAVVKVVATTASGKGHALVRLRCIPNRGTGQCPANAGGGPRELTMAVGPTGSDLDNGISGDSHNFPLPEGSTLRMCLTGCDASTNSACVEDDAATALVQAKTFGPPIPLFSLGVPVCLVNHFATPGLTGAHADVSTGVVTGDLHLSTDVVLSSTNQICPRCSGASVGAAGTCDSGARAGQACRTETLFTVGLAPPGGRLFALSSDCPPAGKPAGTLTLTLPLTTGQSSIQGPRPCGAAMDDNCDAGTCTAQCTGNACATMSDGQCIDIKGGVSQVCCSNETDRPCFPTGSGAGEILRTGTAVPATPAWPDPTYPKVGSATLVATFCEPAAGSIVVDGVAGLPGPGALILPMSQTWIQ